MTKENTNWQIRVNIFDTQENAYKITEAIEALKLGYNTRILNIDKGNCESDDETQRCCTRCGRMDDRLHDYICDACLILEKEKRQKEHNEKYDDDKREVEWDWVAFCPECGIPSKHDSNECYWYCPSMDCDNNNQDTSVNACYSNARETTITELIELQKKYPYAKWI